MDETELQIVHPSYCLIPYLSKSSCCIARDPSLVADIDRITLHPSLFSPYRGSVVSPDVRKALLLHSLLLHVWL